MYELTSGSVRSAKQVGFSSFWEIFISKFRLNSVLATSKSLCSSIWGWTTYLGALAMGKTKGGFYAVARGHSVGIFETWAECQGLVNGYPNARYKKFSTEKEASDFIKENRGPASLVSITKSKNISKPTSTLAGSSSVVMPTAGPQIIFRPLTPAAPAWTKNFKHGIHAVGPKAGGFQQQGRGISSSSSRADFRKLLKVTEDRVTSSLTSSIHQNSSFPSNSGVDIKKFDIDEAGYVVVYTDGACSANGKYGAKAGIGIWFGDNHDLNVSEPVKGRQTNNTAEIQAAEVAISQAKKAGIDKLCVKTDSQFVINCITKWVGKWSKNGWKLSDGQPVKNKEDLEKLVAVMKGVEIKWSYVAGHKGHHGNEEADRLAVLGARMH